MIEYLHVVLEQSFSGTLHVTNESTYMKVNLFARYCHLIFQLLIV